MAAERRHSVPSPDAARVLGLFAVVAAKPQLDDICVLAIGRSS